MIWFPRLTQANHLVQGQVAVAEMVSAERYLVAHSRANGGDNLDITPKNLRGTQFLGHTGVKVLDGLSVGGFGFLLMTRAEGGWTIDLYDSAGTKTRTCRFAAKRLDCPA